MPHRALLPPRYLLAVCCVALAGNAAFAADRIRDRGASLRTNPPRMRSMALQRVGPDKLRVILEYAPDPRLGPRLTLNLAQGRVTFSRRSDGRYVGDVRLTAELRTALAERDRKIASLGSRAVHFVYDERVPISSVQVAPLNLAGALSGPQMRDAEAESVVSVPAAYLAVGALTADPMSALIITDREVVADPSRTWDPCEASAGTPNGTWTFAHLIKGLGSSDPAKLVEDWLGQWKTDQPAVNGVVATARPRIQDVIDNWPRVGTALDLDQAPFRLLAIVNRVDLAENLQFPPDDGSAGSAGSAGELRFVFDVAPLLPVGNGAKECAVKRFQVIFEYQVTASDCVGVSDWAERWISLATSAHPRGSPEFNLALEKITEEVITGGKGHLAQIRTNEIDLAQSTGGQTCWEMREFEFAGGALKQRTIAQTPIDALNEMRTCGNDAPHSDALATWVNANATDINSNVHAVMSSQTGVIPQMNLDTFWDGAHGPGKVEITDPNARFNFSLNTCTGCHARETCTRFNHILGRGPGKEAGLSMFIIGGQVAPDPVACASESCAKAPVPGCPVPTPAPAAAMPTASASPINPCCREFNDLARRQQFLDEITICDLPTDVQPLNAAH